MRGSEIPLPPVKSAWCGTTKSCSRLPTAVVFVLTVGDTVVEVGVTGRFILEGAIVIVSRWLAVPTVSITESSFIDWR